MPPSNTRKRALACCPVCGAQAASEHAPFCSRGCRDRDLLNWLGEGYRIAGRPADPDDPELGRELDPE